VLKEVLDKEPNTHVDYCVISSRDDFHVVSDIIPIKYKVINTKRQFNKVCDFITDHKKVLDYHWYIKTRPDLELLEPIPFHQCLENAVNARAREYKGPKQVKYGMSVGGQGPWKDIRHSQYHTHEGGVVLDDAIYMFDNTVIQRGGFDKVLKEVFQGEEYFHTDTWKERNINVNIIGINICLRKYGCFSGDLNL
jgi:hypothetical protein